MKKLLKKQKLELYHFVDDVRVQGKNDKLTGDCSGLRGDCTGLSGDCTELRGDLDECEIDVSVTTDIKDLVKGD